MPDFKDELLEVLKRDAYKKGEFTLSSGRESNHYVNCKPVTLSGRGLLCSSCLLLDLVEEDSVALVDLVISSKVSFTDAEYPIDFVIVDKGLVFLLPFLLVGVPPEDGLAM